MIPNRVSIASYNLWNTECWPQREPALRKFLTSFYPDILCLQEIRPETIDCIRDTISNHCHVEDPLPRLELRK